MNNWTFMQKQEFHDLNNFLRREILSFSSDQISDYVFLQNFSLLHLSTPPGGRTWRARLKPCKRVKLKKKLKIMTHQIMHENASRLSLFLLVCMLKSASKNLCVPCEGQTLWWLDQHHRTRLVGAFRRNRKINKTRRRKILSNKNLSLNFMSH